MNVQRSGRCIDGGSYARAQRGHSGHYTCRFFADFSMILRHRTARHVPCLRPLRITNPAFEEESTVMSRNNQLSILFAFSAVFAACDATDEPPPPPAVEECAADAPVCDPGCQQGFNCVFAQNACACVPVAAGCLPEEPVCEGTG